MANVQADGQTMQTRVCLSRKKSPLNKGPCRQASNMSIKHILIKPGSGTRSRRKIPLFRFLSHLARQLPRVAILTILSGLLCALMMHFAPGAQVDDRELNWHLNQQSLAAIRAEKAAEDNLGRALAQYAGRLLHGDLGYSQSKNAPIGELIRENAPATAHELLLGLAGSWLVGLGFAIPFGTSTAYKVFDGTAALVCGLLLSLPTALLAYLCLSSSSLAGAGVELVFVLALSPRIFRVVKNLLKGAYGASPVHMCRALGMSEFRILVRQVLPSAGPSLLALAAASVAMALGVAIPIESICDVAGLGRLAWQAALSRDLFLLVNLTMLIALTTTLAMAIAEAVRGGGEVTSRVTTSRRLGLQLEPAV